jgi:hypothetical protein
LQGLCSSTPIQAQAQDNYTCSVTSSKSMGATSNTTQTVTTYGNIFNSSGGNYMTWSYTSVCDDPDLYSNVNPGSC